MIKRNELYWEDLLAIGYAPSALSLPQQISLADARHLALATSSLDLLVTSPPYATCYEYGELHQLTQIWLEHYGILAENDGDASLIGSKVISSRQDSEDRLSTGSKIADTALQQLEQIAHEQKSKRADILREARALHRYFQDMQRSIKELSRVVRIGKRLVLIIGDSRRRGVDIPTTEGLCEMALGEGFEIEHRIVRQVAGRVLVSTRDKKSGRFSSTAQSDTQVYPEENILVFVRTKKISGA
jgi:hypothetical protein